MNGQNPPYPMKGKTGCHKWRFSGVTPPPIPFLRDLVGIGRLTLFLRTTVKQKNTRQLLSRANMAVCRAASLTSSQEDGQSGELHTLNCPEYGQSGPAKAHATLLCSLVQ